MVAPASAPPFISAGNLVHRITLQQRTQGTDANGSPLTDWADVATVWAAIEPLSGRELLAAQAIQAEASHVFTVRYRAFLDSPTVVASMRISWHGRIFNITSSANTDQRNVEIVLTAIEGVNQG